MLRDLLLPGREGEALARVLSWVASPLEQTAAEPLAGTLERLQLLWRAAEEDLLAARIMLLDTTPLPVLDASHAQRPRRGSLWRYIGDEQTALYRYSPLAENLEQQGPEPLLSRRKGYVVASGPSRFETALLRQGIIPCGCNLLPRRLFLEAQERGDLRSRMPVATFQHLYAVEADLREKSPEVRRARRQELSKPAYDDLVGWCMRWLPDEPPSSALGQAIHHVLDNESSLRRFLYDGLVPIDTASFERLRGHEALVREAPLLASSDAGAQRAACLFTLVSCCQLAGVEPVEYLLDVLPRLSPAMPQAELVHLLPSRWRVSPRRALTGLGLGSS
ncbi:IS66 family transposase [Hyalangium gracile]|uniref:IS66 family transposase n=1 Tax=Hyalangium gracile TaxID=394092 RepID=UPI001CCD8BA2|nr:transposase [Hyalangium gracile]